MRRLLPALALGLLVLASGCTQPPPGGGLPAGRSLPPGSFTRPEGPWNCGSLKVNASMLLGKGPWVLRAAEDAGLSFLVLMMDHESPRHPEEVSLCSNLTAAGLLCVPGQVSSSDEGRFVSIGSRERITGSGLEDMIQQARDQGAVVYITSPMSDRNRSSWRRWDLVGWDGLAVVSPMSQSRPGDDAALRKWHAFLNNGREKHAYGETDIRRPVSAFKLRDALDSSYQCLRIEGDLTEDSVKRALSSGASYVTNGPVLGFTVNGSGMGEVLNASPGDALELSVEVSSTSPFNKVRILRDGRVLQEIGRSETRYSDSLEATVLSDTWFAVEVWGGDFTPEYHDPVHAISNPIWVRVS